MFRISALTSLLFALTVPSEAQSSLRTRQYVAGLSAPVAMIQDPADPALQFVVEQGGRIRAIRNGTLQPVDFLDLRSVVRSAGEQGLLGLAFPPDAATNPSFYVNFVNLDGHTVIARFKRSPNPLFADPTSRFDLRFSIGGGMTEPFIRQPFTNHKGGHLAFGPDGYLYIGMGDGGSGNDPMHLAQNRQSLLGKMLRIDVNVPDTNDVGFVIPPDNPFRDGSALPEIWSFGLRNPWRWSFDDLQRGGTGALIVADVGQSAFEEVNYEPRGAGGRNYGWRNREGAHDNVTSIAPAYLPLTDPIFEYGRAFGGSITGGYIYRGKLATSLVGRYVFGDFISSRIWSIAITVGPGGEGAASDLREHTTTFGDTSQIANVSSFGVDAAGELYIISYSRGVILKVVAGPAPPSNTRIIR